MRLAKIGLVVLLFLGAARSVYAGYVLPYPSSMPGHKLYGISRIIDRVKQYWYFGSIAQFKYTLALADKYLVEAKTLFEYQQYLLARDALRRSDHFVSLLPDILSRAHQENKDISHLRKTYDEAMTAHAAVLEKLKGQIPERFLWEPEHEKPTDIALWQLLDEAISLRKYGKL